MSELWSGEDRDINKTNLYRRARDEVQERISDLHRLLKVYEGAKLAKAQL